MFSTTIHLWDVPRGTLKPQPEGHNDLLVCPSFSPDGKRLATSGGMDGTIRVWNAATGEPLVRIRRRGSARACAFSADGRTLYSCWTDDNLYLDDVETGRELRVLQVQAPDRSKVRPAGLSLYLSDDRSCLIVFSRVENRQMLATVFDAATGKQLFQRKRVENAFWDVLSPDGRILAAPHANTGDKAQDGRNAGLMHLEDLANGEVLLTFPRVVKPTWPTIVSPAGRRHQGQTWPLAFSPAGRLLLSCTNPPPAPTKLESTLYLWEVLNASEPLFSLSADQIKPTFAAPMDRLSQIGQPIGERAIAAFSPDGRLLATNAPSVGILLWDVRQGKERHRFKGFEGQVTSLAFSPDGRRLISGLSDSTLLVWDVASHAPISAGKHGTQAVAKAWTDLAGTDVPRAFRARWTLASAPKEAMTLLTKHLHPVKPADSQRLRRLLADLGSDTFAVREKSQEALENLGDVAEPALRKALDNKPILEVRRRVQAILERLHGPVTRPELLQALRAVAVLEDIGTPEARRLLQELAKGAPEARLTREVKASLQRLDQRRVRK